MNARFLMVAILMVSGLSSVLAAQTPKGGSLDARVTSVTYQENNVVQVFATYGISTMIIFDEDEKFETISLGDTESWQVVPAEKGNILFVKPIAKNVATNMNVVTDKRIYYLELHDYAPEAGRKVFGIRFHYPEKNLNAALRKEAEQRAAWPNISGIDKANVNIDYSFSGDARMKPLMVFDDGDKTFFKFDRRVPAIFAVNANFSETLKNFRREAEYIVVDGTATQFTLRDGDQWICIFNLRKPDFGAPDPSVLGPVEDTRATKRRRSGKLMQRAPELDALGKADDPIVADRSVRRNQLVGGGLLILFGLIASYFVIAGREQPARDMLDGDEEFTTTTFRPPSFVRDGEPQPEPVKPEVIELPPPPPPPAPPQETVDTTEFDVPPPPVPAGATLPPEAAEPPKDEFPERFRSNMIVYDNKAAESDTGGQVGGDNAGPSVAGEDRASKFLAAASSLGDRSAKARKIERIDALVPEGTLIPGILETAIVSDLPGQIRAIVSDDVYSFDGRRVLIPTGTRLIGEYQSEVVRGQKRIFVVWTRMLRDDGVSVRLDSIGADSLGRSGLTGRVDNKFRERFGAAILLSIVGGGASYLAGYGSQAASGDSDDAENAEELARNTIAETFSDMANQALGDSLRIPPTISVSQGERIFVFVRQDLDFSAMYEDPVTEALREIHRERGLN